MKAIRTLLFRGVLVFFCCFSIELTAKQSKIKSYNFSVWSAYQRNDFEGLTQEEKTEKLTAIFKDQSAFVKNHGIRRLIVKILDPNSFSFFHPEKFSLSRDDNFYFWASKLKNDTELEILFDCSEFQLSQESLFERLTDYYRKLETRFVEQENLFGNFKNIIEKMEWVAWINELYATEEKGIPLISGITLDPRGMGSEITYYQNLVNAFDQFRFQNEKQETESNWAANHSLFSLRLGMLLPLDMKDFALANLSPFPLSAHLRVKKKVGEIGITLPKEFPSKSPHFPLPPWRSSTQTDPLLDTVYLQLGDPRLVSHIYQNYEILPNPDQQSNHWPIVRLVDSLEKCFRGIPFVKGPGNITNLKGTSEIKGAYTFFLTGSSQGEGQFAPNQVIEIRPPHVPKVISRTVQGLPQSNKTLTISSTFSTTLSLKNVEYWLSPIPCNWSQPKLSSFVIGGIYFVVNTDYQATSDCYFGNWESLNFLNFMMLDEEDGNSGFIHRKIFTNLNGKPAQPSNNVVLYDYSTIPNGNPFPHCDWKLGNKNNESEL